MMSVPDPVPARVTQLVGGLRLELGNYLLQIESGQAGRLSIRRHGGSGIIGYLTVNPKHPSDGVVVTIYQAEEFQMRHFQRFLRIATGLVRATLRAFEDVDYDVDEEPDDVD